MVFQAVATALGDDIKMMGDFGPKATGALKRAVEGIVGIVHPVAAEGGFQTAFVEGFVMSHERQVGNLGFNLPPNVREDRGVVRPCTRVHQ